MANDELTTADTLRAMTSAHPRERITIHEIFAALHDRGFALLLVLFALPMALPLPWPPGFSSLVSVPLLFVSAQMALGLTDFWLPEKIARKDMPLSSLKTVVGKAAPWIEKIDHVFKPSLPALHTPRMEQAIGAFSLVLTLCILLPLSVLTNTIPAMGITLMALGLLERDGRVIIAGIIAGLVGLAITIAILTFGAHLVMQYIL